MARTASAEPTICVAGYHAWKGAIERGLAVILLIPGMPIIALLVLIVRLTSRGPGIYRQVRVGHHGKTFAMYKIRTMRNDAERASGPAWTQKDDPRVTPIGRVLRKLHLDEFPQLFNVIKGEMALIGPRPERPEFTQVLAREIPCYMDRVVILPGITGLAQINLPPDTDLDSVRRKLVLDLEYVRTANMLLDVRMLACTLLRMLGLRGDYAMRLMRLQRMVIIPMASAEAATMPGGQVTPATIVNSSLPPVAANASPPVPTPPAPTPPTPESRAAIESRSANGSKVPSLADPPPTKKLPLALGGFPGLAEEVNNVNRVELGRCRATGSFLADHNRFGIR